jgi:hypothetical protein
VTTYNNETPPPFPMFSGVPYGSILGLLLYAIYTADIPQSNTKILSTFADNTAISTHPDPTLASTNLQDHLRTIENWTRKWRLKINETKTSHITFTLRRGHCPPSVHQSDSCASSRDGLIPRTSLWLTSNLEEPRGKETQATRPQNSLYILAHWKTFLPIVWKQASHLQNNAKTSVDVRNRTMGMCY